MFSANGTPLGILRVGSCLKGRGKSTGVALPQLFIRPPPVATLVPPIPAFTDGCSISVIEGADIWGAPHHIPVISVAGAWTEMSSERLVVCPIVIVVR
jgi:hypothetical protein